jgi:hypothetical protein
MSEERKELWNWFLGRGTSLPHPSMLSQISSPLPPTYSLPKNKEDKVGVSCKRNGKGVSTLCKQSEEKGESSGDDRVRRLKERVI